MHDQNSSEPQSHNAAANSAANNILWNLSGRQPSNVPSLPTTLPQNIFSNPPIQPTSIVNLSNSSDVVIGPMTQYQGPVTIYQYMDATVESRSMQSNGSGGRCQSCIRLFNNLSKTQIKSNLFEFS